MKKHGTTVLLVAVLVIGLSVLLYPTVSDYINSINQSRAIALYTDELKQVDTALYEAKLAEAREYNQQLLAKQNRFVMTEEELEAYNSLLKVGSSGVMGYVEIPVISVRLPLYHSTDEAVLQVGIGHIEGTSLPVGGQSTHSAVSGHRGLPSALLLSNLDQVVLGDRFIITVLNETLTYEVDQITVVEPEDMSDLAIVPGEDYVTLVTCTPYGINSHRLLVRGFRTDNEVTEQQRALRVTADARQIDTALVAPIIAAPILLILLIYLLIKYRKKKS